MSLTNPDRKNLADFSISRRSLIGGAIVAGTALAFGGSTLLGTTNAFAAAPALSNASAEFLRLSELLTGGKALESSLAARYQAALVRHDPQFTTALAALQAFVADSKATDIDDLLSRPDLTAPVRETITKIVSAWYLGIVGADADAELIAYSQALMYRPTIDVLVIPTYGAGPDSWGKNPALKAPATTSPASAIHTEKKA